MERSNKTTKMFGIVFLAITIGIVSFYLYNSLADVYDGMNESIVEGDANKYLDAIALYCISNDKNSLCTLDENSETVCIADTDDPLNVSLDFKKIISEKYTPKYDKAYIKCVKNPFTEKLEYKITFITDNYQSSYSKPINETANNITRYLYFGDSNINGNDNIILDGSDFERFSVTKKFSTTAKNIMMNNVDVNTSKDINSSSNESYVLKNIILNDCVINGLNITSNITNVILSGSTICIGENSAVKGESNISLNEVDNIILKDNAYILANNSEDSGIYFDNIATSFKNNNNENLKYLATDISGKMKINGSETITNIVTSGNAILDLDCASDVTIKASGNSIVILNIAKDKNVHIESISDEARIVTNEKLSSEYDAYFSKVIYSKNEWYLYQNK